MMRLLYTIMAYLLAPLVLATMVWRGLKDRAYWRAIPGRLGFGANLGRARGVWMHAVSLGEVAAAAPLVRSVRARHPDMPVTLTTTTPTGERRARQLFPDGVDVRYLPMDLPGAVRRFFERVRPCAAVILETEIWPNLYAECRRRGVPLLLASARLSARSVARYRRLGALFGPGLLQSVDIAAQSDADGERFLAIGAAPARTRTLGNVKFDFAVDPAVRAAAAALRTRLAPRRPVWIAGSTHEGEEEQVLDAHAGVCRDRAGALLVLVPRHPARFDGVARQLERRGISYRRRTETAEDLTDRSVLLLDTTGELQLFYGIADVAFVGGSLVAVGGHNLLEPAALGVPIVTGPHQFNGADIAARLDAAGGLRWVRDANELAVAVAELLGDARARECMAAAAERVLTAHRGAVARLTAWLEPALASRVPPASR